MQTQAQNAAWHATVLKQTICRQKGASNYLAWCAFGRNPLLGTWELSRVRSQGQGGVEVVQCCFILCLSCPSQHDMLCAQRQGDGETLFITNM